MSENDEPSVLGALPHSRAHRRSPKRGDRAAEAETVDQTATEPSDSGPGATEPSDSGPGVTDLLRTAVQVVAELAEIGITVGARALRAVISRLPRP